MTKVVEVIFMCLMYKTWEGEEGMDVSCLTKVHHGMEEVNWGEVAVRHE